MPTYSRKKMVRNLKKLCPALYEHTNADKDSSDLLKFFKKNFKSTYRVSDNYRTAEHTLPLKVVMKIRWIYNLEFIRYNKELIEFHLL